MFSITPLHSIVTAVKMCPGPAKSIKMVLVGDSYVGKTSLAQVFVHDHFRETYSASVGGKERCDCSSSVDDAVLRRIDIDDCCISNLLYFLFSFQISTYVFHALSSFGVAFSLIFWVIVCTYQGIDFWCAEATAFVRLASYFVFWL